MPLRLRALHSGRMATGICVGRCSTRPAATAATPRRGISSALRARLRSRCLWHPRLGYPWQEVFGLLAQVPYPRTRGLVSTKTPVAAFAAERQEQNTDHPLPSIAPSRPAELVASASRANYSKKTLDMDFHALLGFPLL